MIAQLRRAARPGILLVLLAAGPGFAAEKTPSSKSLSLEEVQKLESDTAKLCGVRLDSPNSRLPWFYHYVLAERLQEKGDGARALEQISRAIQRKPRPAMGQRIYGLWFLDYLPFSLLARIHDSLEQPECAEHARDVAKVLEPRPRQN
jgi:hypothetical protein